MKYKQLCCFLKGENAAHKCRDLKMAQISSEVRVEKERPSWISSGKQIVMIRKGEGGVNQWEGDAGSG